MNRLMSRVLATVLVAVASVAATRLVAMRVEVEPVRAIGPDTIVTLVLQVAPEDRDRIGRDVLLRAELRRGGDDVVSRVTRTVELDDGVARFDTPWPPGSYELRVDIEGVGRDANGFWRGRIDVPRLEPEPTPSVEEESVSAGAAAGAAATVPGRATPGTAPPAAVGEPERAKPATPDVAPAEESPDETSAPEARQPEPTVTTPAPAVGLGWGEPAAGEAEVTVSVLEQARGVGGLDASAFEVEVDGDPVPVSAAGGAGEAPLRLVLAVDVSASMTEHLPELRRQLTRLAFEATASGGGAVLVTLDSAPVMRVPWGGTAEDVAEGLAVPGVSDTGDLSRLVLDGLAAMREVVGRRAMLVVTDGGDTAGRSEWNDVVDAAAVAGGPVLVVGFRSDDLESRTARALDRIAEASGGDSWTLRDTSLLEAVLEAYGEQIEGAYALRFRAPSGDARLDVDVVGGDWEVLHPDRVR